MRLLKLGPLNISQESRENRIQTFDEFLTRYKKQDEENKPMHRDRSLSGIGSLPRHYAMPSSMRVFPDRSRSIDMVTEPTIGGTETISIGGVSRVKTRSVNDVDDDVRIESARKHSPRQKFVEQKIQEVTDVGNRIHEVMAIQTMKAV